MERRPSSGKRALSQPTLVKSSNEKMPQQIHSHFLPGNCLPDPLKIGNLVDGIHGANLCLVDVAEVELIEALTRQTNGDSLVGQSLIRAGSGVDEIKGIGGGRAGGSRRVRFGGGRGSFTHGRLTNEVHQHILLKIGIAHQLPDHVTSPVEDIEARSFAGGDGDRVEAGTKRQQQEVAGSGGPSKLIIRVGGFKKNLQGGIVVTADAAVYELVVLGLALVIRNGNRLRRKVSGSGAAGAHDLPKRQSAVVGKVFCFRVIGEEPG